MGLLDRFKKSRKDVVRTQNNLTVSQQNLSKAEEVLQQAKEEDKKLKDRFVGKLFRGKLIEDIYALSDDEVIRVHCRLLSFEEYLTNDYEELVKDDAWISGPFGVYGGVADRKEWNSFITGVSAYSGDAREYAERYNGVVGSRMVDETRKIVRSLSFTRDEQQVLKKILTDELGMDEKFFYPKNKGVVDTELLKEACDKVVEFIVKELEPLKENGDKYWYHFFEEGSQDAFVDKIVPVADTIVDELVKVKELEK